MSAFTAMEAVAQLPDRNSGSHDLQIAATIIYEPFGFGACCPRLERCGDFFISATHSTPHIIINRQISDTNSKNLTHKCEAEAGRVLII